jgi:hypothetical protein
MNLESSQLKAEADKEMHQELRDLQEVPVFMEMETSQMVNFPTFTGIDPVGWLAKAETIFKVQEIHKFDQLQWAFISIAGESMCWFSAWCREDSNLGWESFSKNLILRFSKSYIQQKL